MQPSLVKQDPTAGTNYSILMLPDPPHLRGHVWLHQPSCNPATTSKFWRTEQCWWWWSLNLNATIDLRKEQSWISGQCETLPTQTSPHQDSSAGILCSSRWSKVKVSNYHNTEPSNRDLPCTNSEAVKLGLFHYRIHADESIEQLGMGLQN